METVEKIHWYGVHQFPLYCGKDWPQMFFTTVQWELVNAVQVKLFHRSVVGPKRLLKLTALY